MASSSDSARGTYLPTGWRIVGQKAERIAERAMAAAPTEHVMAGPVENTLYAVECTTEPAVRGRPTVERILDAVTEEVRQTWEECPRLLRDEEVEREPSRFGGLRYRFRVDPGREWVGEVVWRAVHPLVPGAPITTRLMLEERPHFTRLGVRVTADDGLSSVRGYVGAGQAQPPFLGVLREEVTPTWMGGPLTARPIRFGDENEFIRSVLEDATRSVPVAVLSPLEEGGYLIEPEALAWELFGRARLYVMGQHQQTFNLTDAIGDRRMSCYFGAARCYMPGWSRHDDFHDHPLLVRDRLVDPVMRAAWLGEIGVWSGRRATLQPDFDERFPPEETAEDEQPEAAGVREEAPPAVDGDSRRAPESRTEGEGAAAADREPPAPEAPSSASPRTPVAAAPDPMPLLEALLDEVRSMGSLIDRLLSANADLTDEVERLRTISSVRSSSTNAIERRLGRLEDILDAAFPDGSPVADGAPEAAGEGEGVRQEPEEDEGRLTLQDVVRDAAETHADELVFLDSAFSSAADSPYEDPERVRALLDAMARVSRRRTDGALGTSLREAFADLGIDYRGAIARSTSARLREQYRFPYADGLVEAEEHIVLGNTYDPRRCLRIYFSSRVPSETRFVIGHVGRHFEVASST